MFLTILSSVLTIISNMTSMSLMRAEMASTPEEKARIINEGMAGVDLFRKLVDKLHNRIDELKDDKAVVPIVPVVPAK